MKKIYTISFPILLLVFIFYGKAGYGQCAGGEVPGAAVYDTTIRFPSGVTHKLIKFPKFNPQSGMLSCVKLIVTMTGIIDTSAFENLVDAPTTVTRTYNRSDHMSGPGLTPDLTSNFSGSTSIPLGSNDNVTHSGPDFYSSARDTVLTRQMNRTLTDSTSISEFYGTDSVVYNYDINVVSNISAGGDIDNYMRTSAFVNFRFEYCSCPISTLPLGLMNFTVAKAGATSARLSWATETDKSDYIYEIEMSRDGKNFTKTAVVFKNEAAFNPSYQYRHLLKSNEWGPYYFRVKQRWLSNGYSRFTEIRTVDFANPLFASISLYPNPSTGIVGVKFVSVKGGRYLVQISNVQGQVVVTKEVTVAQTDYKVVATLGAGLYYVKLTDVATRASCINQIVIK